MPSETGSLRAQQRPGVCVCIEGTMPVRKKLFAAVTVIVGACFTGLLRSGRDRPKICMV